MNHRRVFALTTLTLAVAMGACPSAGATPGPPSPSSRNDAEAAVLRLLDDWAAAYVKHDRAAIDRILGEDFVMSAGRRDLQTRAEYLVKVEKDQEPHASITRDGERVRIYGDVAVVNHRLTRTTQGQSFIFRVTDVCVRRDGRWQLINRHITELPQSP
jgi:ketosteroid isomerase-like protein